MLDGAGQEGQTDIDTVKSMAENVIATLPASSKECIESRDTLEVLLLHVPEGPSDKNDNAESHHFLSTVSLSNTEYSSLQLKNLPRHLSLTPSSGYNNIHFIISTLSGTRAAKPFFETCVRPLLSRLRVVNYDVHETQSEHHVAELVEQIFLPRANAGIEQTIVLLSGDGGLVDMINTFLSKEFNINGMVPTVAILPFGTGNAMYTSISRPNDSTFGLRRLVHGSPKSLPTFRVQFSPGSSLVTDEGRGRAPIPQDHAKNHTLFGAVVCSWGLHASLVAESDTAEYRKMGDQRFGKAALELLDPTDGSESHAYQGIVTIVPSSTRQRREFKRLEHMYVLLTLVSHLSKGFEISPQSKHLDGQLRLVHFGKMPSSKVKSIFALAFQDGQHIKDPEVDYENVDSLRIDLREHEERWRRVCVDGKIIAVEEGGWVEVEREERQVVKLLV